MNRADVVLTTAVVLGAGAMSTGELRKHALDAGIGSGPLLYLVIDDLKCLGIFPSSVEAHAEAVEQRRQLSIVE